MIYQPSPLIVDLRLSLITGLVQALFGVATDFIAGENKPWAYYLGLAVGHSATATGIPGAAATIYATGSAVDGLLFHSPDGSLVDLYLNGVLHATIDTFSLSEAWNTISVVLPEGVLNRLDFVNRALSPSNESGIAWMALGPFTVSGPGASIQERTGNSMPIPYFVTFSLEDSDGDNNTIVLHVDSGLTLAQYTEFAQEAAPIIDAITGSKVEAISLTLNIALPGGLKAGATAGIENQKGGNFLFSTTARYKHAIRVPGMLPTLFAGKAVDLEGAGVAAFVNMCTGGLDASGTQVIPRDGYGNDLVSLATATKSHRRK